MNRKCMLAWIWFTGSTFQMLVCFILLNYCTGVWSVSPSWTTAQDKNVFNPIPRLMNMWATFGFALKTGAAVNVCTCAAVSLEKMWRTVTAESQGMHTLHDNRCCQAASKVAVPITTPANSVCKSAFPTLLPMLNSTSIFGIWILCKALMRWWGGEEAKEDVSFIRHGVSPKARRSSPPGSQQRFTGLNGGNKQ